MATAGVYAQYNPQLRLSKQNSPTIIAPVLGANPVDTTEVSLHNVRGHVRITLSASDDPLGTSASFVIRGGYGQYPDDYTWNWYVDTFSVEWCTVTQLTLNTFEIVTTLPLVSRTYVMYFNPGITYPPTIIRTAGTLLGTETLTVTQTKVTSYITNSKITIPP